MLQVSGGEGWWAFGDSRESRWSNLLRPSIPTDTRPRYCQIVMLAPFKLIALSCVGLLIALVPANALPASRGLSIGSPQTVLDSLTLGCPSMTISCVKDGDYPKGIVGDIGKKEFCFSFPRCYQCE